MIETTLAMEVSQLEADICSALADPTRILLLYLIADGPKTVGELAAELNLAQPTTSRHLKTLRDRGLAYPVRQGINVQYCLTDPRLIQALDLLRGVLRDRIAHRADLMKASEQIAPTAS